MLVYEYFIYFKVADMCGANADKLKELVKTHAWKKKPSPSFLSWTSKIYENTTIDIEECIEIICEKNPILAFIVNCCCRLNTWLMKWILLDLIIRINS